MTETNGWRVDDLAQRSGVSVDTIRFYEREGLLPPPARSGRTKLYGPEHLTKLVQIRDLQRRRFSLAGIRAILDLDHPGYLIGLFSDDEASYSREQLADMSGVSEELLEELSGSGALQDPVTHGREGYDNLDLRMVQAIKALLDAGFPTRVLLALTDIYRQAFDTMQEEALMLILGEGRYHDDEELAFLRGRMTDLAPQLLAVTEQILGYLHRRTVERMTMREISTRASDGEYDVAVNGSDG